MLTTTVLLPRSGRSRRLGSSDDRGSLIVSRRLHRGAIRISFLGRGEKRASKGGRGGGEGDGCARAEPTSYFQYGKGDDMRVAQFRTASTRQTWPREDRIGYRGRGSAKGRAD